MVNFVVYGATWCNPCKQLKSQIASSDFADKVTYVMIDEDIDASVANGIRSVPTTIIYKDGQEIRRVVGNNFRELANSVV